MKKFTIYLAGDSTVQSYKTPVKPITGWGQMLHTYFKETEQKMNQDGCDWMGYGKKSASDFDQSIIYETDGLFIDNRAMAYFDYRKQGQFDWTTPAILFACLTFSLIAPNYIWKVL